MDYCITKGNFTGRWYSYYKRALSCIDGECYDKALYDLNKAIQLRDKDQWWVNSYGMHYLDYFPHREKGIIHYIKSQETSSANPDLYTARYELERSIQQETTGRALFYLNKVKKMIVLKESRPASKPVVKLMHSGKPLVKEIWTKDYPFIFSGKAMDINYISEIKINKIQIPVRSFDTSISFTKSLFVSQMAHQNVDLTVCNLSGQQTSCHFIVNIDRSGPLIIVKEYIVDKQLKGYVYDKAGLKSLHAVINGQKHFINVHDDHSFVINLNDQIDSFYISAIDILGNVTRKNVVTSDAFSLNQRWIAEQSATSKNDAQPIILFNKNVSISVDKWYDKQFVFEDLIHIDGQILSQEPLSTAFIQIGNDQYSIHLNKAIVTDHYNIIFSHTIPLKIGRNMIRIVAMDLSERIYSKEMVFIKQIPDELKHKNRYTFKLFPFDTNQWKSEFSFFKRLFFTVLYWRHAIPFTDQAKTMAQLFLTQQLESRKRFQVITDESLKKLFDKHQLDIPDQHERNNTTYHCLLVGDTKKYKNESEIIVRMINPETSEIIAIKDAYRDTSNKADLESMAFEISDKFHEEFPLIDGLVTDVTANKATIDFESVSVPENWPVIVYDATSSNSEKRIIYETHMGKQNLINNNHSMINIGNRVVNK
jgi:hypothetical protein